METKPPKDIVEANGYKEIRLQINTYDGKEFTLSREFNGVKGEKIRLARANIDRYDLVEVSELNAHAGTLHNDVSTFLLDLVGLNGRKLKYDKNNAKKELSFRELVKFCLIDEQQIISDDPPIYSGQIVTRTIEESLFKLLLSGIDDEQLAEQTDIKIYRAQIKGKIELIELQIENKEKEESKLKELTETLKDEEINAKINDFTRAINDQYQLVLDEEGLENLYGENWKK